MEDYIEKQMKIIEAYYQEIGMCIEKIRIFNEGRKEAKRPFILIDNDTQNNILSLKNKKEK